MTDALRLGTRRSPMALAQSGTLARLITDRTGREVELVPITSHGDVSDARLTQIGGTGVFVSALRESLLRGEVDFAVHSLKDLPTGPAPGITLAAVPPRDDPRDALVAAGGAKLADLPSGARVGTGSPRRAEQLRLLRPDIECVPVRGNAGTRLAKVREGKLDAVVLARAGLARISRADEITEIFEPGDMVPAPGQGALAVECRDCDPGLVSLLESVDHPASRAAVTAERALLAALEAGCTAPVGAHAAGTDRLWLEAIALGLARGDDPFGVGPTVFSRGTPPDPQPPDARPIASDRIGRATLPGVDETAGSTDANRVVVRVRAEGDAGDAARLGRDLAERMLANGAARLIGGPEAARRNRDDLHD